MDVTDPTTWEASTLDTPEGPIDYWVLADLPSYYEQYEDDNNLTRVKIAVAWGDVLTFKKYALGFTDYTSGLAYFNRYGPLEHPAQEGQFLRTMRLVSLHAGVNPPGTEPAVGYAEPNELLENWFDFPAVSGMRARAVYEAVFQTLHYDVQSQDDFRTAGSKETTRHVVRMKAVNARERKVPSFGFEVTIGGNTVPVPEVGFIPFYDYELYHSWHRVPRDRQPDTAIANCLLKANDAAFDYNPLTGTFDKYREGDLVFTGLAKKVEPYRGPSGEWLVDLHYVFRYQPADGTGDGMLKIPYWDTTSGSTWVQPRVRGTAGSPKYLYSKSNFDLLFQPEP